MFKTCSVGALLFQISVLLLNPSAAVSRYNLLASRRARQAHTRAPSRIAADPAPGVIPILLDTDIGTDIDDAFALALIIRSPELDLVGVTTASGDTRARARLAAKMLTEAGRGIIPVVAGKPGKPLPIDQTKWAADFNSPQIRNQSAPDFLKDAIDKMPGKITLVAIGPLTNVAELITEHPDSAHRLKRIVLMGGAIAHGYGRDPKPAAEYNIKSDVKAAQTVFSSGIPILMVPLDATAMDDLDAQDQRRIFTHLTTLTDSLTLLYHLWGGKTPILFDPMTVATVIKPDLCVTRKLAVRVDQQGFTRVMRGKPANADVAVRANRKAFLTFYLSRVAP